MRTVKGLTGIQSDRDFTVSTNLRKATISHDLMKAKVRTYFYMVKLGWKEKNFTLT